MIKRFGLSVIGLVLVIGIVICVNYITSPLSARLDLTEEKEFTLADSSLKILDRLEDRVTIKLYYSKKLPPILMPVKEHVADIINEYKAYSKSDIVVDLIEPDLNEETEQDAVNLGIAPLELNVIERDKQEVVKAYMGMAIYYRDRKQVIPVVAQVQNLEYLIDLSLLKLTQKELPRIGVYIGGNHSKYRLVDQVVKEVAEPVIVSKSDKHLESKKLSALLVVDPVEVTEQQLEDWDNLMAEGIPVMVFSGKVDVSDEMKPEPVMTGLDEWLSKKGVRISDQLALDVLQNEQAGFNTGLMQVYMPYPFWLKAIKQDLNQENIITSGMEEVMLPWSNVIEVDAEAGSTWNSNVLINTSKKAFLQVEGNETVSPQYLDSLETLPELASMPLSVELINNESSQVQRLLVTSNHHMLQDAFLQRNQSNVVFLANMIESATWGDYLIGVRSRGKTSRPLKALLPSEKTQIRWLAITITPLAVILLGGLFNLGWNRRRRNLIQQISRT